MVRKNSSISESYKNGDLFVGGYDQRNRFCPISPEGGFGGGGSSHDSTRCDSNNNTGLSWAHGKGAGGYTGGANANNNDYSSVGYPGASSPVSATRSESVVFTGSNSGKGYVNVSVQ